MANRKGYLPQDSASRKRIPMFDGLMAYFPDALAAVAEVSFEGNEKHNPGQPLHWARGKSMDHLDCIIRHASNAGGFDGKIRESAALAWRSLANLQMELERDLGLDLPPGAKIFNPIPRALSDEPYNPAKPHGSATEYMAGAERVPESELQGGLVCLADREDEAQRLATEHLARFRKLETPKRKRRK